MKAATVPAGVHALTPDGMELEELLHRVGEMLDAGVSLIQYRDKAATAEQKRQRIAALQPLCRGRAPLIVNDDMHLVLETGADGVHLGPEDGSLLQARRLLGNGALLGASCRDDAALVQKAAAAGADYLAFGCCFASQTKPNARRLPPGRLAALLDTAGQAALPAVAIGGIDAHNLSTLLAAAPADTAGPHAIAVCAALFAVPSSGEAAAALCRAFAA